MIVEAEAGLMHMWVPAIATRFRLVELYAISTGEPDGPPCKVGVAATDIATGLYAHGAIMAGLLSREKTGQGVWIDCNLFESQVCGACNGAFHAPINRCRRIWQLAGLANIASNYLIAGEEGGRHGTAHPSIVPYQVFPCKDGFIMIGAGNDKQVRPGMSYMLRLLGYGR